MGKAHKMIVKMEHLLVLLNAVILITGVAVRDHSLTKRQASDFLRHKRSAQDLEIRYENGLIYNEQWVPKWRDYSRPGITNSERRSEYGIAIYEIMDESGEYFSTWMPDLEDWWANPELIQGPPRTSPSPP